MEVKLQRPIRIVGISTIADELGVDRSTIRKVIRGIVKSKRISDHLYFKYKIKSKGVKSYGEE